MPLGATPCTDVPGSLRFIVIEELGENHYRLGEVALQPQQWCCRVQSCLRQEQVQYMMEHTDEARILLCFAISAVMES